MLIHLQETPGALELAPLELVPSVRAQLGQGTACFGTEAPQLTEALPIIPAIKKRRKL